MASKKIKKNRIRKRPTENYITFQMLEKILNEVESVRNMVLTCFIVFVGGCRVSEAVKVKKSDIDFKNKRAKIVRDKTNHITRNRVPDNFWSILEKYLTLLDDNNDYLFPSRETPEGHINSNVFQKEFREYLRKANLLEIVGTYTVKIKGVSQERNLYNLSVHGLRHLHVSFLRRLGIPDVLVAKSSGHKSTRTLDIYSHTKQQELDEVLNKAFCGKIKSCNGNESNFGISNILPSVQDPIIKLKNQFIDGIINEEEYKRKLNLLGFAQSR